MSTSIIKLHTFSGVGDNYPPCFILQVDDFYCLLDCGWCEYLPKTRIADIGKWVKKINAVLISHPSMRHLGLLPILVGKYGLKCPVYATTPVCKLGHLVCYDEFQSRYLSSDFDAFTLDDVDSTFEKFVQVKYSQTINLQGRGLGISVTPLPSGHMLGGTIWKIVKDETDIVYAVDYNNEKSRHLKAAAFDACIRPRILIIDVSNALYTHIGRKNRVEDLRQILLKTLRRGGNVLIPVDTAGYCLEIANILENMWHSPDSGFMAYGLAMLSHVGQSVFDFTRSLVEWMSDRILRTFEDQRSNPFQMRYMQVCHTIDRLEFVANPKVILATDAGLRCGFSRLLFTDWADNELNTIILTSRDGDFRESQDFAELLNQTGSGGGGGGGGGDVEKDLHISLSRRLIGLSQGEAWAKQGLDFVSADTPIIPIELSQRIAVSQEEAAVEAAATKETTRQAEEAVTSRHPSVPIPTTPMTFKDLSIDKVIEELDNMPDSSSDEDDDDETAEPVVNAGAKVARKGNNLSVGGAGSAAAASSAVTGGGTQTQGVQPYALLAGSGAGGALTHGRHLAAYDILPATCSHSGGQFFKSAKRKQLVFPSQQRLVQWDDYGEKINTSVYRQSAEAGAPETANGGRGGMKRKRPTPALNTKNTPRVLAPKTPIEGSGEVVSATKRPRFDVFSASSEQLLSLLVVQTATGSDLVSSVAQLNSKVTTRCVKVNCEIPLRCEVNFIDFESRTDKTYLSRLLTGMRPHEVILVGACRAAIDTAQDLCLRDLDLPPSAVHTPRRNGLDVVNCTREGDKIAQVRLRDSLMTVGLHFTRIRQYELAWIDADVVHEEEDEEEVDQKNDVKGGEDGDDDEEEALRRADALPVLTLPSGEVEEHPTVFVNEPRLSDVKEVLLAQGLSAVFVRGTLVVNNTVAIRRSEAGRLHMEGVVSPVYFAVRDILYRHLAIL